MPTLRGAPISLPTGFARHQPLVLVAVLSLFLAGCGKGNAPAAGAGAAPPPPQVGVVTVTPGDVGLVTELPGRLEASRVAQVGRAPPAFCKSACSAKAATSRPASRCSRIDSAPYAAAAASAQAGQARAEANLAQATALAERYKPLVEANAISKQEYANAVAAQKQAEADVAVGKADVQTANINLGYAAVTAPISGRIGRSLVTEGALVGQGDATQLAVIQQINPMYVNFTQSASDVMKLRRAMASGQFKRASGADAASVRIVLEDGTEYAQPGKLAVFRPDGGRHHRPDHLARRSAQPGRPAAARPVCARAAGAGAGQPTPSPCRSRP